MKEFKVNEYITLKLESNQIMIYVKGQQFRQCKFLLLNIPVKKITSLDDIESIDEVAQRLDRSLEGTDYVKIEISPETEFWGHCSNIQTWYEHNYDTRLLYSNLAFPLLKKLVDSGDPLARKVFKEEIVKRVHSGYIPSIYYLVIEGYLDYLNENEINLTFLENNPKLKKEMENLNMKLLEYKLAILVKLIDLGDQEARIISELPETIEKLNNINLLNFRYLNLTEIPEITWKLTSLKIIDLTNNKITKLPKTIGILNKITNLNLGFNNLTKLPKEIINMTSLRALDLTGNKITEFPEVICNLPLLQYIYLKDNNIKELPKTIEKLNEPKVLVLEGNKLTELPDYLGKLTSLHHLTLKKNKIKQLPESLGKLNSLKWLDLRENQLTSLPNIIGDLKSLEVLELNQNQLKNLPKSIINMTSLKELKLKENLLDLREVAPTNQIIQLLKEKGVHVEL